uniref:D-xylose 1-dehydrogenase n=1 Tax=Caulobacter sp. (strain K31) TaxID=366602 RepID=B0T5Q4_CAUSK
MRFTNRVAIVTGAGGGIGKVTARLLAAQGAVVAVNDLDAAAAQATLDDILSDGGQALAIPGDAADEDFANQAVAEVMRIRDRIDILVNNAGISVVAPAEDFVAWDRVLRINLYSQFFWSKAVAKAAMIPAARGAIVNVASIAGLAAVPNQIGYVVSKHGVVGLTRSLAVEWGRHGIRVNCVCPGITATDLTTGPGGLDPERLRARVARVPLGRMGTAAEQAEAIAFLASDEASYLSGLILNNDGGQLALHSGVMM